MCPTAGPPSNAGDPENAALPVTDAKIPDKDVFAALPTPILEDILDEVFEASECSVAARAQLSLVCKCVS